jgi:putative ABC transport system substrate-binding protein
MKAAVEAFAAEPNGGLLPELGIMPATLLELIPVAAQYRLPAVYARGFAPTNGGLLSYAADPIERLRGAATYVDRVLRGTKVRDLPVQYPTKFSLVINLRQRRRSA